MKEMIEGILKAPHPDDSRGIVIQFNSETHPIMNYIKMCCRDNESVVENIEDYIKNAKGRCWVTILVNEGTDISLKPSIEQKPETEDLFSI